MQPIKLPLPPHQPHPPPSKHFKVLPSANGSKVNELAVNGLGCWGKGLSNDKKSVPMLEQNVQHLPSPSLVNHRNAPRNTAKIRSLLGGWPFLPMTNEVKSCFYQCYERKATLLTLCVRMSPKKEQSPSRSSEMTPSPDDQICESTEQQCFREMEVGPV